MKRDYKLYMDFGTSISTIWNNPKGFFYFVKDGTTITEQMAANYFSITGDHRYFRTDRSTLAIKSTDAYLKSAVQYDVSEFQEFTFSFFYRIPKDTMNLMTLKNFPIEGFKWDDGEIILYSKSSEEEANSYKGRYIHIDCCGIVEDLIYKYQSYNGEEYIHIAITMKDNMYRIFLNGVLIRETVPTNPIYEFNNLLVGNFTPGISQVVRFDTDQEPTLILDELCICDRCFWTTSFNVPTRPLIYLFPEIVEDESETSSSTLATKINSAPNFYSRYKTFFDADLDRAEIARPDNYKPSFAYKSNMYNKHKFDQYGYDYTAKSNWDYLYKYKKWPNGKP